MHKQPEIPEIIRDLHKISGYRVSIHDVKANEMLSYPAPVSPFCHTIQQNPQALKACKECDAAMLQKVRETGETIFYTCQNGLLEAAAPIYHYGVLSGFLMVGQVRDGSDENLQLICDRAADILGDRQAATALASQIPIMDQATMRAYLSIATVIATYITQTNSVKAEGGKLADLIAQYIRQHYHEHITLEILAQKFGYCNATITKTFRREYNTTIFNYLRDVRLEHAVTLLKDSSLSVKEIAASCGIHDQNYFSRLFAEQYRMSPTAFREANATK